MPSRQIPGIYTITNKANGRAYVDASIDCVGRWRQHLHQLRKGEHPIDALQRDFSALGEAGFEFVVVEEVELSPYRYNPRDRAKLLKRERWWIRKLGALDLERGYNLAARGSRANARPLLRKRNLSDAERAFWTEFYEKKEAEARAANERRAARRAGRASRRAARVAANAAAAADHR